MRNPNGYGGVCKLPGNRRRPYRARVTVGWDDREDGSRVQRYATIGYFATRGEAMRALADYNRSPWDPASRSITFKGAFDQWSPGYFEKFPSTRRVTECAMGFCRQIWDLPLRDLRSTHLQGVISAMDGKSRGYQAKVRSLMHMVYRWAISREVTANDWSQFVELTAEERESPRRIFTSAEVNFLWELRGRRTGAASGEGTPAASALTGDPRLPGARLLDSVLVLLYTGMRVGELLGLRLADIHREERYIDLRGTKTRAARRTVPIHRDLLPVLGDMMASPARETLIACRDGGPMSYSQYKAWFDRAMESLEMSHTPHDTRHTFVSALDTAGVRRAAVKFIIGHSQHDVTDRYTHKNLPELLREVDKVRY